MHVFRIMKDREKYIDSRWSKENGSILTEGIEIIDLKAKSIISIVIKSSTARYTANL